MKKKILALSLILVGCGESEKTILLIDPSSGCQYVGTMYAQSGLMAGSHFKPVTDDKGKQHCKVPDAEHQ